MYQYVRKIHLLLLGVLVFICIYTFQFFCRYRPKQESFVYNPYPLDNKSFLIQTPGCNIPKFDPFDPSVKRFYVKTPYSFHCASRKSVFKILDNGGVAIIEERLAEQYQVRKTDIDCYFYPILRQSKLKKPDEKVVIGKRHDLVFDLPIDDDFIVIKCFRGNVTILRDILPLTPLKPAVEEECSRRQMDSNVLHENLNVIIVGIDSVSKLNFLRYFRKSMNFLSQNLSAFELHGYNKVADNTYPNLVPLLTGHQRNYFNGKERGFKFFDDVDFVWKEYARIGYRTLYAEDAPKIGTFVLNRRGFKDPPTNYYARPFALSVEGSTLRNNNYCIGARLELEVYFDYLKRFVRTMGDRPFFSFMFLARLTHDIFKQAGYADKPSFELLRDLDKTEALNRSLLIFFSDHGIRFGGIRKTYIGKIEERMPFVFLVLPEWFLNKYPTFAGNLKANERRLTTPYDIHATLLHLLQLQKPQFLTNHGQSLLTEISPWRTCSEANVSPHWCVCQVHQIVPTSDENVQRAAMAIISKLNAVLKPYGDLCVRLYLERVLDARVSKHEEKFLSKKEVDFSDYLLTLRVKPSAAVFEATVHLRKSKFTVPDEISRINRYANQSHCIEDSVSQKYCFCKDMLNGG